MIIAYSIGKNGQMERHEVQANKVSAKGVIWFDLLEPTIEEERAVEKLLDIDAPTREEMDKIEVVNPFYRSGDAYYMTITVVNRPEFDYPENEAVTFILTSKCLVTLRYSRPKSFSSLGAFMKKKPWVSTSPDAVLENITEMLINSTADTLEKAGNELDHLLKDIFDKPSMNSSGTKSKEDRKNFAPASPHYYNSIIKKIGLSGNLISKSRESLMSINRMLIFFGQIDDPQYLRKKEHRARLRHIAREVNSLSQYVDFLSQRNAFLLEATLGMLNVEQNVIIKVFTVAAAVFLPPTLIASIYGMNFKIMPETHWDLGYPMALFFIILSALLPYYYFKRKGWL